MMTLLIPILILIILSGMFSASETAYSSASKIRLRMLEADGVKKAVKVLKMVDRFDSLLTTILVGNNIVNITLTTLSTLMFVEIFSGDEVMGSLMSTIVITVTVLVCGEITPKMIARTNPERMALFYYFFLRVSEIVLSPINIIFMGWKGMLVKVFKLKTSEPEMEDELVTIVETAADEGKLLQHESELIKNAIEFDDLEIKDIMVPRVSVLGFPDVATPDEVAEIFGESNFSRLPMYHGTIDTIIGFVHEKDFNAKYYKAKKTGGEADIDFMQIVKPTACVSLTMRASLVLKILQRKKQHLAVVVDEFGGTAGIVTIEDILEELVGEIYDEHDEAEELVKACGAGEYIVSGVANAVDVLEHLGATDGEWDSTSMGGWVIEQMGKIPTVGEKLTFENLEITVLKANLKRVLEVKILVPDVDGAETD